MDIMDDFPDDFGNEKPNIYYKCSDEDCNHTRVVHDYYHMVCTLKYPVPKNRGRGFRPNPLYSTYLLSDVKGLFGFKAHPMATFPSL